MDLTPYVPRLLHDRPATPTVPGLQVEGTLVFADLSGFTALSERLAHLGREGAEVLTERIDETFTRLLEPAYEAGGSLLKMGGDALLLYFGEEGHALRACYAAASMRRRLREAQPISTPAGRVTLRMSVGVHSGCFVFVVGGSTHAELVVCGPDVSTATRMESIARSGQILLSPATSALVGPRLVGAESGPGRLLRGTPPSPDRRYAVGAVRGGPDVSWYVPQVLRAHLTAGGGDPEHRLASVAFVRAQGTDGLVTEGGAGRAATVVGELLTLIQDAADRNHVTFLASDVDSDAFKVILTAGVPDSEDDDAGRLLLAALDIAAAATPLEVKVGVNAGRLFSGSVGPGYRRTYTVMGDVVNTAARLMSAAAPGTVLASSAAVEQARTRFQTEQLGPLKVKGRRQPVVAHKVGAPTGEFRDYRPRKAEFLGRDGELDSLVGAFDAASRSAPVAVEVVGEPGMGKSRMLEEARARAGDVPWLQIRCDRQTSGTPFFALKILLRRLLGCPADEPADAVGRHLAGVVAEAAPELTPWTPLLAVPVDARVPSTPEADRLDPSVRLRRIHDTTIELMSVLLPGEAVLAFDDAHWMDEASAGLLRTMRSRSRRPWTLVTSRRDVDGGLSFAGKALTVALGPLEAAPLRRLVREVCACPLLPADADMIVERSAGNPLLAAELVDAFTAGADELPADAEALLAARIDRLPPADRTRIRHLAVLGNVVTRQTFDAVAARIPELDLSRSPMLSELVEVDKHIIRFRQALFQEVAYDGLPYRRRRKLHAGIAEALESSTPDPLDIADQLSWHFHAARDFGSSWRYSTEAARRARGKRALNEAVTYYRRALEAARTAAGSDDEVVGVQKDLAITLYELGRVDDAVDEYRRARAIASQPAMLAELLHKEGVARYRLGRYPNAVRWYRKGLRIVEDHPQDREARVQGVRLRVAIAEIRQKQGRYAECIRLCRQALDEASAIDDLPGVGHAWAYMHAAAIATGDDRRETYGRNALEAYERLGEERLVAMVLNNLANDAYQRGDWDEARSLYERAKESFDRVGRVVEEAVVSNNLAEILSDQGDLEAALGLFGEVVEVFEAAGASLQRFAVMANMGRAQARAGRPDQALELLRTARSGLADLGAHAPAADAAAWLAEAYLVAGEPAEALAMAEESEVGVSAGVRPALERTRGWAQLQVGEVEAAVATLKEALATSLAVRSPYDEALTLLALSAAAEIAGGDPEVHARAARAILERLGVVAPRGPLAYPRSDLSTWAPSPEPAAARPRHAGS